MDMIEEKNFPVEEMTEKEKRYNEIIEKKNKKKRLSFEEKIFLKEMEINDLKIALAMQLKKEKDSWIKDIFKILKPELEKIYNKDNTDLDLKITTCLLKTLENIDLNIEIDSSLKRGKNNKIIRVKKEI